MNTQTIRGMLMVLAAALLWGTTGTAQSFAPPQLAPTWVGAWRLGVAALFFALLQGGRRDQRGLDLPALRRLPWPAIALAAACMCVYNLAFFAGVRQCGVAIGTAVALGSGPLWAGVLQALISRRLPARPWWLGTGLAVAGVAAMASGGSGSASGTASASGLLACLLAGLAYAGYALLNQGLVARAPPATITSAVFGLAAALALPGAWLLSGAPALRLADAGLVLWLGVVSTGVAYLLFSHALRHVSAATAVVLALAEPVTAFVLAIVVVGERPGWTGALGLATVLAGLAVVVRSELAPAGQRDGACAARHGAVTVVQSTATDGDRP